MSNELIKNLPLPTNLTLSAIEPMAEHNGSILRLQPNSIPQVLKQNGEWGKWAILCKTNVGIKVASKQLSFQGVPNVPLIIDSEEKRDINEQLFTNKVKVLTVHSAKGLEFDNVILNEAYQESKENLKLMYVAITRAKNRVYLK